MKYVPTGNIGIFKSQPFKIMGWGIHYKPVLAKHPNGFD